MEENDKIKFNSENGLNYVSDKMLYLCELLLEKSQCKFVTKKNEETIEKVGISSNIINLCNNEYDEDDIIEAIEENNNKLKYGKDLFVGKGDFTRKISCPVDNVCLGCKFQKCPKYIISYMLYLKDMGLLEEKLKEREEFRKKNIVHDAFDFNWKIDDKLKYVTDEIFEFSNELVNRGYIYIEKSLSKERSIVIRFPSSFSCLKLREMSANKEKIPDDVDNDIGKWSYIKRNPEKMSLLCDSYTCRLSNCILLVAGYIYYLKKTGQEDIIQKAREYYKENKEKIDLKIEDESQKKIKEIEEKDESSIKELLKYSKEIPNINFLIDILVNKLQKNLHCTIEGEKGVGKTQFINKVSNVLYKLGKVESENINIISLQNFASKGAYSESNTKMYRSVMYNEIEQEKVYVLTNIKEFVNDYNLYKSNNGSGEYIELRKKQFEYVFELLTSMYQNNYIIIMGTEEEIDQLMDIEPKLKFVYQNYRFKFPSLSVDDMYIEYTTQIKSQLIDELRKNNEEYKKKFVEFVSMNKKFLPFANKELSLYLAMYSNSKNEIVFPDDIYNKQTIEESFSNIIGLENVKQKVRDFEKYMIFQLKAKNIGLKLSSTNMHMIFTGNPGTGKTTVARIMAKMLFDLGVIQENKLVEVEKKDLIASYIGQTAPKTAEVIEKAMGGVLFIDEAYSIVDGSTNSFGPEAIATLIKAMEDHKGEIVVIFAGYKDEMKTFIDSNPGIASRIGYTFDFEDYSPKELVEIFNKKMNNIGFELSKNIDIELLNICSYFSKKKSFGNGRFVDKLIQETLMKHSKREVEDIKKISIEDIPTIEELNNTSVEEMGEVNKLLNDIVGLESVKEKIKDFEAYIRFIKNARNKKINVPATNMHMIFTGNPGTGKTTVARIMAKMLFDLGIIHENKLVEVEKKDLIASYVGQTAPKTAEVIEKAMGGVLFIDEAYSITDGTSNSFGLEAIATLIKAMEDHKGEFIVIFAGYKKEMKTFIDSNSGIASRIGYIFDFEDYTNKELEEILYKKVSNMGMTINTEAEDLIEQIMKYFCNVENIGNGRFVDKVLQEIIMKHAKNNAKDISTIVKKDIPTIKEITNSMFNGNQMIDLARISDEDIRKTATHEIGHAVTRLILFKKPGIKKITITAEGTGALGYVRYENTLSYTQSKEELMNNIKVSLAGMVSEQVFLGYNKNGNTSDLEKATYIARNMVTRYGMSQLGLSFIGNQINNGEMEVIIQKEINNILNECFDETKKLIEENKEKMAKVIDILYKEKEIDEETLIKNFKK